MGNSELGMYAQLVQLVDQRTIRPVVQETKLQVNIAKGTLQQESIPRKLDDPIWNCGIELKWRIQNVTMM